MQQLTSFPELPQARRERNQREWLATRDWHDEPQPASNEYERYERAALNERAWRVMDWQMMDDMQETES